MAVSLRPDGGPPESASAEGNAMPYRGALFDKVNKGFSKTETDRNPGHEGWGPMPSGDLARLLEAMETGRPASPSRLTGKLTYGLSDGQRCWSSQSESWGPNARPASANSGRPWASPLVAYHGHYSAFPKSGRPCSAGSLGEGFRAVCRGRTPPATTTWERGGPRGGTQVGSICQQLHLIKATKGQYAGLSRIIGKPGGGCGMPRKRTKSKERLRPSDEDHDSDDNYILLPTADPNRRLSDYNKGLGSQQIMLIDRTQKAEQDPDSEEFKLGPRQEQEKQERQQRYNKIRKQMEALEAALDILQKKLQQREEKNEYAVMSADMADLRRSAKYVRERINNLLRDITIEEKLQPPPRMLPNAVLKELDDAFLDVKALVQHGESRVAALETCFFIQQKHIREGQGLKKQKSRSPSPEAKVKPPGPSSGKLS